MPLNNFVDDSGEGILNVHVNLDISTIISVALRPWAKLNGYNESYPSGLLSTFDLAHISERVAKEMKIPHREAHSILITTFLS